MDKRRKYGFLLGVVAAALAGAAYYATRAFTAKVPEADGRKPEYVMLARDLYEDYERDEAAAAARYTDKLIELTGVVEATGETSDGHLTVRLATGADFGSVACEFPDSAKAPATGTLVVIKGYCAGFNMDVLLLRCAFAPTKTQGQ